MIFWLQRNFHFLPWGTVTEKSKHFTETEGVVNDKRTMLHRGREIY